MWRASNTRNKSQRDTCRNISTNNLQIPSSSRIHARRENATYRDPRSKEVAVEPCCARETRRYSWLVLGLSSRAFLHLRSNRIRRRLIRFGRERCSIRARKYDGLICMNRRANRAKSCQEEERMAMKWRRAVFPPSSTIPFSPETSNDVRRRFARYQRTARLLSRSRDILEQSAILLWKLLARDRRTFTRQSSCRVCLLQARTLGL